MTWHMFGKFRQEEKREKRNQNLLLETQVCSVLHSKMKVIKGLTKTTLTEGEWLRKTPMAASESF